MKNIVIHIVMVCFFIANSCYSNNIKVKIKSALGSQPTISFLPIGLVLDTNSPFGSMLNLCIEMALSDFYLKNPNFTTLLQLHIKHAQTVLDANLAVEDLLKYERVQAIIGPQWSTQDVYLSELGQKFNVPIISTTARSSSPSTTNNFFVRTTMEDSVQARALAALCQEYQWPQAVLLYEDTEYGHRFESYLIDSFRDPGIGIVHPTAIPLSADRQHLSKLLTSLDEQETKVFLVHANPSLGFRLFEVAKNAGMMREGSAWIVTDSMSNFMSSMDSSTWESMEGVVAVRPYVPPSKELRHFQERFQRNNDRVSMDLNIYGLWAYDTITALAVAAQSNGPNGSQLLRELSNTSFRGLSGNFELVEGTLKPSELEIVNLFGTGERRVGLWNPHQGITKELSSNLWSSTKVLRTVVWPGDSVIRPQGWSIPPSGNLRVGVPWKPGFKEFVNASIDPATGVTHATGFAIDMFLNALKEIPGRTINYTFMMYNDSTDYDTMLHSIPEKYDMIVADATIWAPRASYVDFSLPYSESGVVFVVKNIRLRNMWIFFKPFSLYMWLTLVGACVVMGFVVWRLECLARARETAQAPLPGPALLVPAVGAPTPALVPLSAPAPAPAPALKPTLHAPNSLPARAPAPAPTLPAPAAGAPPTPPLVGGAQAPTPTLVSRSAQLPATDQQEKGPAKANEPNVLFRTALFVPVTALAFPEMGLVRSKTAMSVLVCWMFSAFIVMQSYTANLSAILTLDELQFSFSDDHYIGYHDGSFTKKILTDKLNISAKRLKPYASVEEYDAAMCKGSKNGGVDAIFDELPYMKLMLNKYRLRYKLYGPTFRTDGLGFAFSRGSQLVAHFSRGILGVTQGPDMIALEQKNFGPGYSSQDPLTNTMSQGASILTPYDFYGLFIILGGISVLALFCSEKDVSKKFRDWKRNLQTSGAQHWRLSASK